MARKQVLLAREDLESIGSLITIKGTDACLGDLMYFDGHGTYDPDHGLVPVSKEEADTHNKLLDEARLDGLDRNCEVGQGSFFYFTGKAPDRKVTTFVGTVVSTDVRVNRQSITFVRKGKTFRGRLSKNFDSFNFRRVA